MRVFMVDTWFAVLVQAGENRGASVALVRPFAESGMHTVTNRDGLRDARSNGADDSVTRDCWQRPLTGYAWERGGREDVLAARVVYERRAGREIPAAAWSLPVSA